MDIILDPNVAYVLLVITGVFTILTLISPGTGILELITLILLVVTGWELYNQTINPYALGILLIGIIAFVIAIRRSTQRIYLIIANAAFVIGSIFLFSEEYTWDPAVDPILALVTSVLASGFLWVAGTKIMEASQVTPTHDLSQLVGQSGETKTDVYKDGSIQVAGELWSARSETPIPSGTDIRVTSRDGFMLEIEPIVDEEE
jgi:membrane-bound serine protease (ClpP class)